MSGSIPEGLEIFVGTWTTTGLVFDRAEDTPTHFTATDTFEMMPGGKVMLHRSEGRRTGTETSFVAVIRDSGDGYECDTYDRDGTTSHSCAKLDGHDWHIDGDGMRFRGKFDAGFETLSGQWYRDTDDKPDQLWMQVTLARQEV